ncbi:hypothetical protein B296_00008596 [Ensete ventricosum]|uniref:Uncharacterized protein n=1 Tax=Ensete ventricosum TaxID=4639 RepID=A0A427B4G3_ENSVE|nr:hypothetical protein B296_00008596 [Ensete ventricosum]
MAPNAVPLRSKWTGSARHIPPGHSSVSTIVTGFPEHAAFLVHRIFHDHQALPYQVAPAGDQPSRAEDEKFKRLGLKQLQGPRREDRASKTMKERTEEDPWKLRHCSKASILFPTNYAARPFPTRSLHALRLHERRGPIGRSQRMTSEALGRLTAPNHGKLKARAVDGGCWSLKSSRGRPPSRVGAGSDDRDETPVAVVSSSRP